MLMDFIFYNDYYIFFKNYLLLIVSLYKQKILNKNFLFNKFKYNFISFFSNKLVIVFALLKKKFNNFIFVYKQKKKTLYKRYKKSFKLYKKIIVQFAKKIKYLAFGLLRKYEPSIIIKEKRIINKFSRLLNSLKIQFKLIHFMFLLVKLLFVFTNKFFNLTKYLYNNIFFVSLYEPKTPIINPVFYENVLPRKIIYYFLILTHDPKEVQEQVNFFYKYRHRSRAARRYIFYRVSFYKLTKNNFYDLKNKKYGDFFLDSEKEHFYICIRLKKALKSRSIKSYYARKQRYKKQLLVKTVKYKKKIGLKVSNFKMLLHFYTIFLSFIKYMKVFFHNRIELLSILSYNKLYLVVYHILYLIFYRVMFLNKYDRLLKKIKAKRRAQLKKNLKLRKEINRKIFDECYFDQPRKNVLAYKKFRTHLIRRYFKNKIQWNFKKLIKIYPVKYLKYPFKYNIDLNFSEFYDVLHYKSVWKQFGDKFNIMRRYRDMPRLFWLHNFIRMNEDSKTFKKLKTPKTFSIYKLTLNYKTLSYYLIKKKITQTARRRRLLQFKLSYRFNFFSFFKMRSILKQYYIKGFAFFRFRKFSRRKFVNLFSLPFFFLMHKEINFYIRKTTTILGLFQSSSTQRTPLFIAQRIPACLLNFFIKKH